MSLRFLLSLPFVLLLGCKETPTTLAYSDGSFSYSPVLATKISVGPLTISPIPRVVLGQSDIAQPRTTGTYFLNWPQVTGPITVSAQWVEILTNRAWEASIEVSAGDLVETASDAARLQVFLGANGELVVGSDPAVQDGPPRDLAQTCGQRVPEMDRDIASEVNDHAKLAETLAMTFPPVPANTTCPEPKE